MFLNFSFSNGAVGYIIDGVMDTEAIHKLQAEIIRKFEEHDTINLYLEDGGIEHISLDSVFIGAIFPHKYAHRLNKVAMVTNRKWIHKLSVINSYLLGADFKNFTIEDRLEAIEWISKG